MIFMNETIITDPEEEEVEVHVGDGVPPPILIQPFIKELKYDR